MKDLATLRLEIDSLDKELMQLLGKRMALVQQVGEYKKAHQIPVVDMNRWREVLTGKLTLARELGLDVRMIEDIYNRIHQAAITLEENTP